MNTKFKNMLKTAIMGLSLGFVVMGSAQAAMPNCNTLISITNNAYAVRVTSQLEGDAYLQKLNAIAKGNDYLDFEREFFVGAGVFFVHHIEKEGYLGIEAKEMLDNMCREIGNQRFAVRLQNRGNEYLNFGWGWDGQK